MTGTEELVGDIYESIGDAPALENTVQRLVAFTNGRSSQFGFIDRSGRWVRASVVGVDPSALGEYLNYYVMNDPRSRFSFKHPGDFYSCLQMIEDSSAFQRTEVANYLNRTDLRFMMGAYFGVGPDHFGGIGFFRARKDGPYEERDLQTARRLMPHLQRAMSLHVRMGRLESGASSMEGLVDRLGSPVLLVDQDGFLRHANAAGLEALRRSTYLMLRHGRVEPARLTHGTEFRALLAGLPAEPSLENVPGKNSMRLSNAQGGSAILTAYAFRGMPALTAKPQAQAVLFLNYPGSESSIDAASLQILFGLTAAETRLATHLVRGGSLPDFCRTYGVSRETAKSQLEALFDKTGTHHQSELVALLHSSVSALLR